MWRRRDSNPRPNKQLNCFLHVYFSINFRQIADQEQPTIRLSSLVSKYYQSLVFLC